MTHPIGTNRVFRTAATTCIASVFAMLVGCASGASVGDRLADFEPRDTTAWAWSEPDRNASRPEPDGTRDNSHNASVAVFSGAPTQYASAESFRRDDLIGVRADDTLPDRLAWPTAQAPDLRRQRIYRSSVSADRWVFPSTRRDGSQGRRSYNFRSGY